MRAYNPYIEDRTLDLASYIVATGATIREAGEHFRIPKSTVHRDMVLNLKKIDAELYEMVRSVLDKNLEERASRGGRAVHGVYDWRRKDE